MVLNTINDDQNDYMDNTADLRERISCPVYSNPYLSKGQVQLPDTLVESLINNSGSDKPLRAVR